MEYDVVDVSDFNQVKETVEKIAKNNKIDILINNAGITKEKAEAKVETKSTKKKEEKEDDPWVEDEEGNFVRKSTTTKKKKGK